MMILMVLGYFGYINNGLFFPIDFVCFVFVIDFELYLIGCKILIDPNFGDFIFIIADHFFG
jgi:hypothetical protein